MQRVRERVRRGGHTVPEQKIRDRHARLWAPVRAAIQIADVTEVLDNSSARTRSASAWAPAALRDSA